MTVKSLISTPLLLLALTGCGQAEPRAVPDVRGERLDVAERRLDDAGLEYERVGGGTLGVVVRSNWEVCDQEPAPGRRATRVRLIVDRHCPPPPRPTHVIPDLTGDELEAARARLDEREIPYRIVGWRRGTPVVCDQDPAGGRRAQEVVLHVAPDCDATPPPPPAPAPVVPDVLWLDLAEAQELLDERGIGVRVTSPLGEVEGHHDVCAQHPSPGTRSRTVTLEVAPRC